MRYFLTVSDNAALYRIFTESSNEAQTVNLILKSISRWRRVLLY